MGTRPSRLLASCLVLSTAGPLAGCGDQLAQAFGFTRNSPNEFTVTTRAPLVLPSSDQLPPPEPGEARPQEQSAREQALETIAPDVALGAGTGARTQGQDALIAQASRASAAPRQRGGELRDRAGLINGLLFWQGRPAAMIVDAQAETQRLSEAAAQGEPPTDGATPILEPR